MSLLLRMALALGRDANEAGDGQLERAHQAGGERVVNRQRIRSAFLMSRLMMYSLFQKDPILMWKQ